MDRAAWAALAPTAAHPLSEQELVRLRGLGDTLDLREVADVYVPLSRLLNLYAVGARELHRSTRGFLGQNDEPTPFVIGVAGSVAVGKSTTARLLRELLARWEDTPRVELVTTDGFLLPNAELERRGLMERKGFPESYDRRALLRFVAALKSGADELRAPLYSHLRYDVLDGETQLVARPDVVVLEGVNVLQRGAGRAYVSDFVDFALYLDAAESDIHRWYRERFLALRNGAFQRPESYFHRYAQLSDEEAVAVATGIWERTNRPNLLNNIQPTRPRADVILEKGSDHFVSRVLLRRV
jgi:type I pantothenate kinase